MTTEIKLTSTQRQVLEHAVDQTEGRINWFPDGVKGGARQKVIAGLVNKALITNNGGRTGSSPPKAKARAEVKTPRTRENSQQALVIAMLKRPEGATIPQIMESTGWQAHTVRGTFAGAFKKKLGLAVVSEKNDGDRVYRIGG